MILWLGEEMVGVRWHSAGWAFACCVLTAVRCGCSSNLMGNIPMRTLKDAAESPSEFRLRGGTSAGTGGTSGARPSAGRA